MSIPLARIEEIIDACGVAPPVEALLPIGVRHRQLRVRTLLAGMMLTQADHRPAHLTRVRGALTALPAGRPGAARRDRGLEDRPAPAHLPADRAHLRPGHRRPGQGRPRRPALPGPSPRSATTCWRHPSPMSTSRPAPRWRWTGPTWRPSPAPRRTAPATAPTPKRPGGTATAAAPARTASCSSAITFRRDHDARGARPARARADPADDRVCSCDTDPARALVPVLTAMPAAGIPLGDILDDSGYAHRDAEAWAIPLRQAGAQLIQDLHPSDRGPKGTHHGAIIANGNLYCPATPRMLLELGPLARDATPAETAAHDTRTAELARYKLGRITSDDQDGYHRVICPAVTGKIRCPLRPASMTLNRQRPEILTPPGHPPACCHQQTITVPPQTCAKTAQKHDYPSAAHRKSYARRTGAERTFSTAKDPASNNIARGWTRLMGLAPLMLWLACLLVVRNQRILTAWDARQADNARRAAAGLPPRTRRRRRKTLTDLATAGTPP